MSHPARVKRTRRRTSRREEFLCGIAFAPVFGRRGRHFGADHIANSPFPQTDVTQRSGDPNAGHPPTGGLRVESPPTGGLGVESLRRGILCGPDLDDARSSLSESLRGGAVTPRTWRFHVVTIVACQIQWALDCPRSFTFDSEFSVSPRAPMRARDDEGR
jgi:hypothetical protein